MAQTWEAGVKHVLAVFLHWWDALPLSFVEIQVVILHSCVTYVLHTARISNVESILCVN